VNISYIIPAAGKASRLNGIPKFLLPINNQTYLLKHHLELIQNSFEDENLEILIGTSSQNLKILKDLYSNQKIFDLTTNSMVETVMKTKEHSSFHNPIYGCIMPDTYFTDRLVHTKMFKMIHDVDAVVSVWKIKDYQIGKFGQCDINSKNRLKNVIDKDPKCKLPFFWGSLMWKNTFDQCMKANDAHFGETINRAVANGLNIEVVYAEGDYFDCGTFDEYKELLKY